MFQVHLVLSMIWICNHFIFLQNDLGDYKELAIFILTIFRFTSLILWFSFRLKKFLLFSIFDIYFYSVIFDFGYFCGLTY